MRACPAPVLASLGFLIISMCVAGQDKARSCRYHWDAQVYAELTKAPAKARAKRNPLEHDPDAIAAGRNLFEQHCTECHGDFAEGGRKGPSLLVPEIHDAQPGTIFWILTNGVVWRGMPVWSKLPEPQRWQLVTYIKSLGVVEPAPALAAPPGGRSNSATALPSPLR